MALQASYFKKVFQFSFKARTSRGVMEDKISWFIKMWDDTDPKIAGLGECGPLPGLSPDAGPDFESILEQVTQRINENRNLNLPQHFSGVLNPSGSALELRHFTEIIPANFPSIKFGVETAILDLMHGGKRILFQNDFIRGQRIPINGLIWMGDPEFMMHQVQEKIAQGFHCIKLKVGSLDFDQECRILQTIRAQYKKNDITIRLDANGAFRGDDALQKLKELTRFDIHSIEQPIKKGLEEMETLCRKSPIPIAFDEELIGCELSDQRNFLSRLRPQFITLKPTLHGGLSGCKSWIETAENLGIEWWVTSALESNIGLNAICQFTANYSISIPQGLGTGTIYRDNFDSPLRVENGSIFLDIEREWNTDLR